MSYCREDLYVYLHSEFDDVTEERLVCCGCDLIPSQPNGLRDRFRTWSRSTMLTHVEEHKSRGRDVGSAVERLKREIAVVGDDVRGGRLGGVW